MSTQIQSDQGATSPPPPAAATNHVPPAPAPAPAPNNAPPSGSAASRSQGGSSSTAATAPLGRRRGLLIGINYRGQPRELLGCVNDARNMSNYLLTHAGYTPGDLVVLTDDPERKPMDQPTRANILRAMRWLVKGARQGDALFFFYAGHGGQTDDPDGDETDGYDEVIHPVDSATAGHITDDEMHRILVRTLRIGTRLTAVFDSCHSGTALDLPYVYSTHGTLKEHNLLKEAGRGLLGAINAYRDGDLRGIVKNATLSFRNATHGEHAYQQGMAQKASLADVVMISSSRDEQDSSDTEAGTHMSGALSYAFIASLRERPNQTYRQLLKDIRNRLASKTDQRPQLSCSHPLDTSLPFTLAPNSSVAVVDVAK